MNKMKSYAEANTPKPGLVWQVMDKYERADRVKEVLARGPLIFSSQIEIDTVKADGQIIVRLKNSLKANERGSLLLDFESLLKETLDEALVVWLEPLGDRSSLRNLRGIEVKL